MTLLYKQVNLVLYSNDKMRAVSNVIVRDKRLTIFYNDRKITTLVCSPGGYEALAAGFLRGEGLLRELANIERITCNEADGLVSVKICLPGPQWEDGHMGDCCVKSAAACFVGDVPPLSPVQSERRFQAVHLLHMIRELDERSDTYRLTGGVHGAALADGGEMLLMCEDIGRHNAVDRVLGHAFLRGMATGDKFLLLSGRVSSEVVIKAARSNVAVVVSRAAPTQLAVELSDRLGVTVIGFARGSQMSIYSHANRILA